MQHHMYYIIYSYLIRILYRINRRVARGFPPCPVPSGVCQSYISKGDRA